MHLGDQRSFVALRADRRLKLRESYSSRVIITVLLWSSRVLGKQSISRAGVSLLNNRLVLTHLTIWRGVMSAASLCERKLKLISSS